MHGWIGLLLAPSLALACQSAMLAIVTPQCSAQMRLGIHVIAGVCLLAALGMTWLAWRDWSLRSGVSPTPDGEASGPVETRRFVAAAGTAVGALSSLLILMMWVAAWVLSPCW
jgi:hypothetical protein